VGRVVTGDRLRFVGLDETTDAGGDEGNEAKSECQRGASDNERRGGERHGLGFLSVAPSIANRTPGVHGE